MPRRPPPTPLRLVSGPLPPRNRPRHTLPSLPHPAFHPRPPVPHASHPRTRARRIEELHSPNPFTGVKKGCERPVEAAGGHSRKGSREAIKSNGGNTKGSNPPVVTTSHPHHRPSRARKVTMRGPWDHAASIKVPFNVEAVLAPPRAAVVNIAFTR